MFYKETITVITENSGELVKLNSLLADLTHSHQYTKALQFFHQIYSSPHLKPDHYTLSTALTAAANLRDTLTGSQLHAHAIHTGLKTFPHVSNTLLSLYTKSKDLNSVKRVFSEIQKPDVYSWTTLLSACTKLGDIRYACSVFDEMPQKNVALWNAMVTGCLENGFDGIALDLFKKMHNLGVKHDNYTLGSVLRLCSLGLIDFGKLVHSVAIKTGYLVKASVVNALITMYFNCDSVLDAYGIFEEAGILVRDQITYNAMIAGLASIGRDEEVMLMFKNMINVSIRPTELTFVSTMSLWARLSIQVYAPAVKLGFEDYTSVSNAAITMWSSCGDLAAAQAIFDRLWMKDVVSWNTMITSYGQANLGGKAVLLYVQMQRHGFQSDEFTVGSLLASSEFVVVVQMIHSIVLKSALILKIEVCNALLSAYSKHGEITQAYHLFEVMSNRNLISWNTIITGFQLNGVPALGLEQFSKLLLSGWMPNVCTFSIVLSICASLSAFECGKQIHGYITKFIYNSDTSLGNALITLYAKCGVLDLSSTVFQTMSDRDIVSWNSMISAYANHGEGQEAVRCFGAMQDSGGVRPDKATFTAVLSACSRSGLVDDGIHIFNSMVNVYGIEPGIDHFACIVDLLGRAGHLDIAETLIKSKNIKIDSSPWWTLFSSCAAHGNLRLGRIAANFLLEMEQNNPAVYVLLSNIYANAGQWEEAANIRELMKKYGVAKQPGSSWISKH